MATLENVTMSQLGKIIEPGIDKLLKQEVENFIKAHFDKIVEDAAISMCKVLKTAIISYKLLDSMSIVVNLSIDKLNIPLD